MSNELKKAAEILVECGYADSYNCTKFLQHLNYLCVEGRRVDPFADTLEGRRQADAIEDVLSDDELGYYDLWNKSQYKADWLETSHHWRLDRMKWCLEQLTGEDNEQKPNS